MSEGGLEYSDRPLKVAIVAGETSGDQLGAGLIEALRARYPRAQFEGIGGQRMCAAGLESVYPMDRLSVMGFVEVLGRLPELLRMRASLAKRYSAQPPDVFVGIDAPDFNIGLELRLRRAGVRTAHYVSPTVWAWRAKRIHKIARAVDLMMTLFPFEARFYEAHGVPVRFVGHPMADRLSPVDDTRAARQSLGMPDAGEVVALLPGSRLGEVGRIGPDMLDAAQWLLRRRPGLRFVAPMATADIRTAFDALARARAVPVTLADGHASASMAAADVVLTASGTATLETLLVGRPMVITYRANALSAQIARRLVRVSHVGLPNLLAGEPLVPELLQSQARPALLGAAVLTWLDNPARRRRLRARFARMWTGLRHDADKRAASAVAECLDARL